MTPIRKPTDPASLTTENGAKKAALLLPTLFPKPKTVPTAHSRLHSHTPDSPRTSPSSASSSCRGQRDQSEKIKSFLRSAKTRQDPFESNGFQDLKFIKWLQVTPVTHNRISRDSIRVQSHLGPLVREYPHKSRTPVLVKTGCLRARGTWSRVVSTSSSRGPNCNLPNGQAHERR